MKEHPRYSEILPFSCVRAYTSRRDSKRQWRPQNACILERLTEPTGEKQPLGTQTLAQSLVCYTLSEVYRLPVRTYAAIAPSEPYRGRPSSHKANLIPQSKRQDTTIIVIPCLCSFTVPSTPSEEPPANKKTYPNPFSQRRVRVRTVWWRIRDSNPRPPACDAGALTS